MLDVISTLFPAPSLEEVIASVCHFFLSFPLAFSIPERAFVSFQVNKDTTTITTHNDVRDIDDVLSSHPALAFCERVDFVKYPWLIEKVNTTKPFAPHDDNKPAVSFESWKDALRVDPKQRNVLAEDLEAHANAQNAVSFPLLLIRAREADVLMLM